MQSRNFFHHFQKSQLNGKSLSLEEKLNYILCRLHAESFENLSDILSLCEEGRKISLFLNAKSGETADEKFDHVLETYKQNKKIPSIEIYGYYNQLIKEIFELDVTIEEIDKNQNYDVLSPNTLTTTLSFINNHAEADYITERFCILLWLLEFEEDYYNYVIRLCKETPSPSANIIFIQAFILFIIPKDYLKAKDYQEALELLVSCKSSNNEKVPFSFDALLSCLQFYISKNSNHLDDLIEASEQGLSWASMALTKIYQDKNLTKTDSTKVIYYLKTTLLQGLIFDDFHLIICDELVNRIFNNDKKTTQSLENYFEQYTNNILLGKMVPDSKMQLGSILSIVGKMEEESKENKKTNPILTTIKKMNTLDYKIKAASEEESKKPKM